MMNYIPPSSRVVPKLSVTTLNGVTTSAVGIPRFMRPQWGAGLQHGWTSSGQELPPQPAGVTQRMRECYTVMAIMRCSSGCSAELCLHYYRMARGHLSLVAMEAQYSLLNHVPAAGPWSPQGEGSREGSPKPAAGRLYSPPLPRLCSSHATGDGV